MSEEYYDPTLSGGAPAVGIEFQLEDAASIGAIAGLADDRTLAEFLRVTPFDGTNVYKQIVPYRYNGSQIPDGTTPLRTSSTVAPSQATDGSIAVNPFRAVVGSRTLTPGIDNWRDIRSAVYVGGTGAGALGATIPIAANGTGNPRWDLVCAQVTVDAQAGATTRRIKDPNSSVLSVQNVFETVATSVAIVVVAGTPSATPTIPAITADAAPVFYIPLAAVRVISGFGPTSALLEGDIRDLTNTGLSTVARMATGGAVRCEPANGNNDGAGTYAANFPWPPTTSNTRPTVWLPPQMVGGDQVLIELDYMTGGSYSHPDGSVIDSTRDWRNRFFLVFVAASSGFHFANDQAATGTTSFPAPPSATTCVTAQTMGQSFQGNSGLAQVAVFNNALLATIPSGGNAVTINVDQFTGKMVVAVAGVPDCQLFVWIMASAPFPGAQ